MAPLDVLSSDDCSAAEHVRHVELAILSEEEFEDGYVAETGIPAQHVQREQERIADRINWPKQNPNPVNEYNAEGYLALCFPHLFPYGEAAFIDNRRRKENQLKFKEWYKFLLHYKDGRFARDPRFRWVCLNRSQRHDSMSTTRIFVEKRHFSGNIPELQQELQQHPDLIKKLLSFCSKIRGTPQFWYQKRLELEAMINTLGVPTLFITLSAADLWWPKIQKLLGIDGSSYLDERKLARAMQLKINENPQIVDEFFTKRVDIFMGIMCQKIDILHYWYRFEWQHRGSPHVHMVVYIRNAPDVRLFNSATPDELQTYCQFYDSLVSAWKPNIDEQPAERHPSRIPCNEIETNDAKSMAQLLNRFQRHTRCTDGYCLRQRNGEKVCRFNYPKPLSEVSELKRDEKGHWNFYPKRNDPLLNEYNPFIAETWRANTHCQAVTSEHAVVNYISKYASKSECASLDYKSLMQQIVTDLPRETGGGTVLNKLVNKIIGSRDYSACEVHHILSGLELVKCSHQFVTPAISMEELHEVSANPRPRSHIDNYCSRHHRQEHYSLFKYCSIYTNVRGEAKEAKKPIIVRLVPYAKEGVSEEGDELYYKQQVVLHSVYRNLQSLKTHPTWKETYLASGINNWRLQGEPDEIEEEPEAQEDEREPRQWMALAAAGLNQLPDTIAAGYRDMDRNFNWFSSYDPAIVQAMNLIKQSKEQYDLQSSQLDITSVTLNDEQSKIIDHLRIQLGDLDSQLPAQDVKKLTMVMGAAGTGKSCVIREMIRIVTSLYSPESVLLMAPTGVAAINIGGETIHSALRFNCHRKTQLPLDGPTKSKFEERMAKVKVILIDEFSMIGLQMMANMDKRLREGNPDNKAIPFGGFIVYLFGDQNQLPPVGDKALYKEPNASIEDQVHGKAMYLNFDKIFRLQQVMRQQGPEQAAYREFLGRLAHGEVEQSDYKLVEPRFTIYHRNVNLDNVIRLISNHLRIVEYNEKRLAETGNPVAVIRAVHKNQASIKASTEDAHGLESELKISVGSRVILRHNLWTAAGLCNGSQGTVTSIMYEPEEDIPHTDLMPKCVLVKFDKYTGPTLDDGSVPILPLSVSFIKDGGQCSRCQFPLNLAYAISIHRSQGITVDKAVVVLGNREFSLGLTYVALSRVRTIEGLYLESCPDTRLTNINNHSWWYSKRMEKTRMDNIMSRES